MKQEARAASRRACLIRVSSPSCRAERPAPEAADSFGDKFRAVGLGAGADEESRFTGVPVIVGLPDLHYDIVIGLALLQLSAKFVRRVDHSLPVGDLPAHAVADGLEELRVVRICMHGCREARGARQDRCDGYKHLHGGPNLTGNPVNADTILPCRMSPGTPENTT